MADRLDDIKKNGVLRAAVFDSNPPFGFVDVKAQKLQGLDVQYAEAIAKKLGVKLELVPTNPANRIPLLVSGKADIVAANFTITEERAKQIDFGQAYFATGARFIARKGKLKSVENRAGLRVLLSKHDFKPEEVAQIDVRILMRAPGIGRKGFDIIKLWLHEHGRDLHLIDHITTGVVRQEKANRKLEQAISLLKRHGYRVYRPNPS